MYLKNLFQSICTPFLLCLLFAVGLQAQPNTCNEFDKLELGQIFGNSAGNENGDTIKLFELDVITTLERFIYSNSDTPGFGDVSVVDWDFGNSFGAPNQYLFISNINLLLDFSQSPDDVTMVSFDFVDGGGEENIGVNGHTAHILQYLHEAPKEIAPEVFLEVFIDTLDGIPTGTVNIYGKIKQLAIGGQEFGLDNFCWLVSDVPPMCIADVVAKPQPCTPNGIFYTEISFDANNPASDSFYIRGNGQNYGKFPYGQTSYKVGPIQSNPNTDYEFVIIDALDPNCTNFTEIGSVSCNTDDCKIYDLWAQHGGCNTDGTVDLFFDFHHQNTNPAGFDVFIDGEFYRFMDFNPTTDSTATSFGYFLPNLKLAGGEHKLTICGNDNPDCCESFAFEVPVCEGQCRVFGIETSVSECKDDGTVDFKLDFGYEGLNGQTFTLILNGEKYDAFNLQQLPITLESIKLFPDSNTIEICVFQSTTIDTDDNFECCVQTAFLGPNCSNSDCKIYDLTAETTECYDDGTFDLITQFRHNHANTAGFDVLIDGDFYEFIPYMPEEVFFHFPNVKLPGGSHKLTICGNDTPNCCESIEFIAPDCGEVTECKIYSLGAEAYECDVFGEFYVDVFFQVDNPASDSFTIESNDGLLGTFPYGKDYYKVGPFKGDGITRYYFAVVDQRDPNCAEKTIMEPVGCINPDCLIKDFTAEISDCRFDGSVDLSWKIDIGINAIDVTNTYSVFIGERLIGSYPISDNTLTISNLQLNKGSYKLTACLDINSVCCKSIAIEVPECQGECRVFDLVAEASECKDNGLHDVTIDFRHEPLTSNMFEVYIGGEKYDSITTDQLPLTIKDVKLQKEVDWVGICVYQSTTPATTDVFKCCVRTEIKVPECQDEPCEIFDLVKEHIECTEDGTYYIEFSVEADFNIAVSELVAYVGNEKYEVGLNDDGLYYLKNVKASVGENEFKVCYAHGTIDCCISAEFYAPDCDYTNCHFSNLVKEHIECNEDGTYYIEFRVDAQDLFDDNQTWVVIDDEKYKIGISNNGLFNVNNVKAKVGWNRFSFCDELCCTTNEFYAPDCGNNDCKIEILAAETSDCKDDGTFVLEFKVDHSVLSTINNEIVVYIDDEKYGFLPISPDGNYRIDQLKYQAGEHVLTVCSSTDADCCSRILFKAPDCGSTTDDCKIYDVFAEAHPCEADGTFLVDVAFKVDNPEAAKFKIVGNGQDYGTFEYGRRFYTIGPIKGDGETVYEFIVKDIENPECQSFTTLDPINCEPNNNCLLADLRTEVSDCFEDGTVEIEVKFEVDNPGNNGFNVFIDGEYVETYGFHQIPFVLSKINLPSGEHKLSICRNDIDNCCISTTIIIPECGTCSITNVTAIATDCINEDFFFVELKFEVEHPSSEKFRVVGNSNLYGVFEYGQNSYRIGPLDGDGFTNYEFIVQDSRNETCASFAELESVVFCEQGFVWPGDANFDNIADNVDLLNIGLAYGKTGPARGFNNPDSSDVAAGAAIAWEGKESEDWDVEFVNGLNVKHADCNGDGLVDEEDIKAIEENYFFTHGPVQERATSIGNSFDPALYVDFPSLSDIELGQEVKVPIIFGSNDIPAEAYGLAFTMKFDPALIKNARVEFTESWMGSPSQNLLNINKNFSSDGLIELALTRKDGVNPFGAGSIGNFIVIIDDIEGYTNESEIQMLKVQANDKEGNPLAVYTPKTIVSKLTDIAEENKDDIDITIYPNPTTDFISIESKLETTIESVDIQTVGGRIIQTVKPQQIGNINVSGLPNGVYIIAIKMGTDTVYRKVVKQ